MKRYSVRPAKPNDIEAVYEIIAKQNSIDYGGTLITLEDLQRSWGNINLESDTCIAYSNSELAGYAELLEGDSPYLYLADRNNIDLAFQLLKIMEERVATQKREKLNLFTRVSEKNGTLLQLFASNGYRSNLSFRIMEIVLDKAPPAPQWADGIAVRTFIQGQDERATYELDEEAAKDKGYHDPLSFEGWAKRMRMDREFFDPRLWFLACARREIVGVALNLRGKESDTGWVDHLSVRRAWREKGIGKALLLHTFAEFFRRRTHHVKLSVDSKSLTNAPRLYESVGMKTIQQYHIYRKEINAQ